ncbi:LEAF RUST 10 DISEASE-RESISTANCE LOCUS RECEPTOR-LIKE PROTEIN KINASE-like 2.1 isoform X2 [Vigna unguiculata]|uniref:LEAF RUST 10 DISEASE-RESISTANCE LOCUS RECEPTOR-LIKE PROTEIN KINASE-like 2.1 isoform X2 n=1 Tax=Vigna unguiculata TaxID=3917 RepID=UPI0010167B24|nr:LEAF RUST 10 DISEASE-RESISTANCE LOCUS RECEPTOR-LIKE PROTEIN KINASE-like 2.1 isoform X2 [Vigna unguiculata]
MSVLPCCNRCTQSVVVSVFTILVLFHQTCCAKHRASCPSSSCGEIHEIKHPFRLKDDPRDCGLPEYEFDCVNNRPLVTLFSGKYFVEEINYDRYQIRLIDPGVVEDTSCSFPRYFLSTQNFSGYDDDLLATLSGEDYESETAKVAFGENVYEPAKVVFLNCSDRVSDDPRYVEVKSGGCDSGGYIYAVVDRGKKFHPEFTVMDVKAGCSLKVATFANWTHGVSYRESTDNRNVSYADILKSLEKGFWLTWLPLVCRDHCGNGISCILNQTTQEIQCIGCLRMNYYGSNCGFFVGIIKGFLHTIKIVKRSSPYWNIEGEFIGDVILPIFIAARYLFIVLLFLVLIIYKWRKRHFSMFENIEKFLLDNNINPIRYEYKTVKKITRGFKVKLGEGGFGCVYKGKLRSGLDVAVKMLSKSKNNGQEFVNEVASIGRIHHVNVVGLIGYCVEGKNRGLIYEYMSNGSLDKYIFSKEGSVLLSYEKIYEISLGIAHGITYLHRGCDVQILHFDIKPHNILLDDNFTPKVSDFGLAKLYPTKDGSIILTAIRGTLGYMAPELFYKNVGGVSYKADVYSFGMLLMEMASRRKNSNPLAEHSSQHYFPFWIHDQFKEEKDIDMKDASETDKILMKKMFIVALWCIQFKPSDRPSMSKVVEMLEGKVETLEIPPKPSFYLHEILEHDGTINSWSDSTSSNVNVDTNMPNH